MLWYRGEPNRVVGLDISDLEVKDVIANRNLLEFILKGEVSQLRSVAKDVMERGLETVFYTEDTSLEPFQVDMIYRIYNHPAQDTSRPTYEDNAIKLYSSSRRVEVKGVNVKLTPTEFRLFELLVMNANNIVTNGRIKSAVWDDQTSNDAPKNIVRSLRRKVEVDPAHPQLILTRRLFGYMYVSQL